jgi:O-antigen/teichoic acid export membrane protein
MSGEVRLNLLRLTGGTALYGASDVIYAFVRFFLVAIITRILTPADFGVYAIISATLQFACVAMPLGLPTAMIVQFRENDKVQMAALRNTTMLFLLQICAALAVAFFACSKILFANTTISALAGWIILWSVSDVLGMVPRMSLRFNQKIVPFGVARVLRAVVMVVVLLWLIRTHITGLAAIVISEAVAAATEFVFACIFDRFLPRPGPLWGLGSLLRAGLPLTLVGLGIFLNDLSDRYVVFLFLGKQANGYYSAAAKIAIAGSFCAEAFNSMWFPYFFRFAQKKEYRESELRDFSKKLLLLFAALIGFLCIVLPRVLTLKMFGRYFVSPAYHGAAVLVAPLTLVYFFKMAMYVATPVLTHRQRIARLSIIIWIAAIVNIAANILWCRVFGNSHLYAALFAIALMTSLSYGLCMVWVSRDAGVFPLRTWLVSSMSLFSIALLAPAFLPVPLYCKIGIWTVVSFVLYKRQFAHSNILRRLIAGQGSSL